MSLTREDWMAARRRTLRAQVGALEEQLLGAGAALPDDDPAPGTDAAALLARLERRAVTLRLAALDAGLVPADVAPAAAPSHDRAMFDRAVEAEGQLTATQARLDGERAAHAATRAELARAQAALAAYVTPAAPPREDEPAAEAGMSQTDAVLAVLRMAGPMVPLDATTVAQRAGRLLDRQVPAGNVRTYLGRLRSRGLVEHDEDSAAWWLPDPARPGASPPALRAVPAQ